MSFLIKKCSGGFTELSNITQNRDGMHVVQLGRNASGGPDPSNLTASEFVFLTSLLPLNFLSSRADPNSKILPIVANFKVFPAREVQL